MRGGGRDGGTMTKAKQKTLTSKIRSAIKQADDAFDEHIKKYRCTPHDYQCSIRVEFQTRIKTLKQVLKWASERR